MSGKEKTAHAVKASEGGAGNRISGQAFRDPDCDSTTFEHKPQGIADLLPRGAENAISTKQSRSQNTLRAVESAKEALEELERGVSGKGRPECGQT